MIPTKNPLKVNQISTFTNLIIFCIVYLYLLNPARKFFGGFERYCLVFLDFILGSFSVKTMFGVQAFWRDCQKIEVGQVIGFESTLIYLVTIPYVSTNFIVYLRFPNKNPEFYDWKAKKSNSLRRASQNSKNGKIVQFLLLVLYHTYSLTIE